MSTTDSRRKRRREKIAPGLWKNFNADGSVTYRSILYIDGGESPETLTATTDAEAKKQHRKRQSDLDVGIKPADKNLTFWKLKEQAFAYHRSEIERDGGKENGVCQSTLENYERALEKRVKEHPFARLPLSKIDEVQATKLLKYLRTFLKSDSNPKGLAPLTVNETFAAVRNVLRFGREEGRMTRDPFAGMPRRLRPKQEPLEENVKTPLAPGDLRRLLLATTTPEFLDATDTLLQNAVIQSALEGERASETCLTKWRDVDLVDGILTTRGTKSQRSKKRPQALQGPVLDALLRQLEHERAKGLGEADDYVYTLADGSGEPITRHMLRQAIIRAAKVAGLGHVTVMNMRKTTSTGDHYAGVSDEASAAAHGHDVPTRRKHYVMPIEALEQLRADADKRAGFLGLEDLNLG